MTTTAVPAPSTFREAWELLPKPRAENVLKAEATRVAREFGWVLEPDDLGQEFMIFLAEKPEWAAKWFYSKDGVVNFGWMSFKRDASGVMARAAREARLSAGYGEDDTFYSPKQLEQLLPFVFHTVALATVGGEREEISAPTDAAKGGGHMAQVMDVRIAYAKVVQAGGHWDEVLQSLFYHGLSGAESAITLGITEAAVSKVKRLAVNALLEALNGTVPIRVDHEGPGARTARSNASAIAETRNYT